MPMLAEKFKVPDVLKDEHEELHAVLSRATREEGALGAAARTVASRLHPHFVKEEEFALPALALLSRLARGDVTPDMAEVLPLTERLERELPGMLEDHRAIVAALEGLRSAASAAGRAEYVKFVDELVRHAQTEEVLQYPAAVLAGRYIRAQLGEGRR